MPDGDSIERIFGRAGAGRPASPLRQRNRVWVQLFGGEASTQRVSGPPEEGGGASSSASEGDPRRIGRFEVTARVGAGGMGTVYRAYDPKLDRQVAAKVVRSEIAERDGRRMLREAQALARVSHPNVVQVYDVGEADGRPFIAMEFIEGRTLRDWEEHARPSWGERLDAYLQAGRGLSAAHAKGIVHRDFKPANCIIDPHGRVRVLDFGLAVHGGPAIEPEASSEVPSGGGVASTSALLECLTEPGAVLGTRTYMAPEQCGASLADARSDQFSFCVALYEALYHRLPFSGRPGVAQLDMARGTPCSPLPPPASSRVPRVLWRALERGLAAEPEARWPSLDALLDRLDRHRRWTGRHRWVLYAGGGLGAAALAWGLALGLSSSPCAGMERQLDGVWDAERRQALRAAFADSERSHAAQTLARVEPRLDARARAWVRARTQVCEAAVEPSIADEQLAAQRQCVYGQRAAFEHDVALLVSGDEAVVDAAVELLSEAPAVEACARAESSSSSSPVAAELLRVRLGNLRSLRTVGRLDDALALVEPTLQRAHQVGDPARLAEAELVAGLVHAELGHATQARTYLEEAQERALEHGASSVALEAMVEWMELVGVAHERTDAALVLEPVARPLARRHDPGGRWPAVVLTTLARVRTVQGQHREAVTLFHQALEALPPEGGPTDLVRLLALDGLAYALHKLGERAPAEHEYRHALQLSERSFGPRHYRTAHQLTNLGALLADRGRVDEAMRRLEQAAEILAGAPMEHRSYVAHLEASLGTVLRAQGDHAGAEAHLRRAIELYTAELTADQPRVLKVRFDHAVTLEALGRHDQSVAEAEAVLAELMLQPSTPDRVLMVARVHRALGRWLAQRGDAAEAAVHYRRALDQLERDAPVGPETAALLASLSNRLGDVLRERGELDHAEQLYQRALDLYAYEAQVEAQPLRVAHTLRRLASIDLARGRLPDARARLEQVMQVYREQQARPESVAEAEALLAQLEPLEPLDPLVPPVQPPPG